MISRLEIRDPQSTLLYWTKDLFVEPLTLEFKPGLNLLVGPNGSGKSTVLQLMAGLTWSLQGGIPKVTKTGSLMADKMGVELFTDGSPTYWLDPEMTPGFQARGAAFDFDFYTKESYDIRNASSGTRVRLLIERIKSAMGQPCEPLDFRDYEYNLRFQEYLKVQASDRTGGPYQQTVLLDEPDRVLDTRSQLEFWGLVVKMAETSQVILSSHNVLPLMLGLQYTPVEMTAGYHQQSLDSVARLKLKLGGVV